MSIDEGEDAEVVNASYRYLDICHSGEPLASQTAKPYKVTLTLHVVAIDRITRACLSPAAPKAFDLPIRVRAGMNNTAATATAMRQDR